MILFKNWKISTNGKLLAMQYDNLSRELKVVGEIPEGYIWSAMVQVGELFDIILLEPQADGSLSSSLSAQQLSVSGDYIIQLKGVKDNVVRHTNVVQTYVGDSLSGDEHWPEIPSAFSEFEARILDAVERAEDAADQAESPEGGGGLPYKIGLGLRVTDDQTLMVDSAENFEGDNDRPASAALVKTQLGNIEAFLATI
jgi:hypothetical protein